jgi:hypothetical protein
MPSSSDAIGQLAAALAKAQTELVNPVKGLTAVVHGSVNGSEVQTYQYAPLSAGLEIVRKSLGRHELAILQTTHVERESGLVLLTTTLAHSSGEWIVATWPVCRVADIVKPQLMGAALTYARRYSLFTLVGIAGEDDLDAAPELADVERDGSNRADAQVGWINPKEAQPTHRRRPIPTSDLDQSPEADPTSHGSLGSPPPLPFARRKAGRQSRSRVRRQASSLNAALVRNQTLPNLAGDLNAIQDPDALFRWALAVLPHRNRVSQIERAELDAAFFQKAEALSLDLDILMAVARRQQPTDGGS